MGIPEYEAKRYEGRVKDGGVLLSVHCNGSHEIARAKDLLKQSGAEDIASAGEKGVSSHGVESEVHFTPLILSCQSCELKERSFFLGAAKSWRPFFLPDVPANYLDGPSAEK